MCSSGLCVDAAVTIPPPAPAPPPSPGDGSRPWAHNTGPSDPGAITPYTGPATITTDGAIYENFSITGSLKVDADNVTLRNFTIDGNGAFYPLLVESTSSGLVVEDGEIYDGTSTLVFDKGDNNTFKRLNLHDSTGDGFKTDGDGTLVEACFVEKLGTGAGAHADAVQNQAISSRNQIYRGNNFFLPVDGTPSAPGAPYKSNATFIFNDVGSFTNIVIDGNWLSGGNYTIYCQPGVSVRNNLFSRDYKYGILTNPCSEWTNNRWEDTGDLI